MGGGSASQANKQKICGEVFQASGSHTRNNHTCKRLPAQSWGLEPCGALCSSLPHLSTPSKHVLGGPRKHCPGQEEAPRAPPSFLPGKQRQRASGWNRHPGTQDESALDGKHSISGSTLHVVLSPQRQLEQRGSVPPPLFPSGSWRARRSSQTLGIQTGHTCQGSSS